MNESDLQPERINFRSGYIKTIHANMMIIDSVGVLIIGKPGSGKSELCLSLIDRGQQLVSDDAVDIYRTDDLLFGQAPLAIYPFMQINPIGLINIEKHFGKTAVAHQHQIDMAVQLCDKNELPDTIQKLIPTESLLQIIDEKIPLFYLPNTTKHCLPLLLEALVKNFLLHREGYSSYNDFIFRNQS